MKNIKYLVLIVLTLVLFGCNYLNNAPTITGNQSVTYQIHDDEPNYLDLVTILDTEDDDILERVTIDSSDVDMDIIGTYTVEYSVIDSDGVGVTFSIEITITDSRDITLDLIGNDIVNVLVGETYTEQGITAINADNEVIEYSIEGSVDTNTVGTYTLTYNLENYPQTITRTVNVVDTIPPVISLLIEDYYIQVGSYILIMPLVNIEDNYYTSIILFEIITEGEVDLDTIGVYDIAYYVIDPSLNQSNTVTMHVHVVDEIIPNITLNGSDEIYLELGESYTELGATVLIEDGYYDAQIDSNLDINIVGDYTITYSYVVSDEITLTTTRLIHVIDTTAPTISFEYYDYYVHVGDTFLEPDPILNDDYYDINDLSIEIIGEVNTSEVGSYTISYIITDPAGNVSTEVSYTVYVVEEAVPSINLYGDIVYDVEVGDLLVDPGAYVILEHSRFEFDIIDTYDTTTLGTFTIDYTYIEDGYNLSVSRIINIIDTQAPSISLEIEDYYIGLGEIFVDPLVDIIDNYYTDSFTISNEGTVDTTTVGIYDITYYVIDGSLNQSNTVIRHVHVIDDTVNQITINGELEITLELGETYTELGATALTRDGYHDALINSNLDLTEIGTYTIEYYYIINDELTLSETRTIIIIDTQAPVISSESDQYYIHVNDPYVDPEFIITDNYTGDNFIVNRTGFVDTSAPSMYIMSYTVTDPAGNVSNEITFLVSVVYEMVPSITLFDEAIVDVEVFDTYEDAGAYVILPYGMYVAQITEPLNTDTLGTYTVTLNYTDDNYNLSITRDVNVVDTEAPVISLIGDSYVVVDTNHYFIDPGVTVTDNYDLNVSYDSSSNYMSSVIGIYTITYTATDSSGNIADSVTRTVQVIKRLPDLTYAFIERETGIIDVEVTNYDIDIATISLIVNVYDQDMILVDTLSDSIYHIYEQLTEVYSSYVYTFELIWTYDLEDGNGIQEVIITQQLVTRIRTAPMVNLYIAESDNHHFVLNIYSDDYTNTAIDGVCTLDIFKEETIIFTQIISSDTIETMVFDDIDQGYTYRARVVCEYNIMSVPPEIQYLEENVTVDIPYFIGTGTEYYPYLIETQKDLENISVYPNAYYQLMNDITITGDFESIKQFSGEFNGNFYTISNLYLDKNNSTILQTALFDVNTGVIKNLYISNATAMFQGGYQAILVARNSGLITNVFIYDSFIDYSVSTSTTGIGFITGLNTGYIDNVAVIDSSIGSIFSPSNNIINIGTVVGVNDSYGIIENVYSNSNIELTELQGVASFIGGITGKNNGNLITAVYDGSILIFYFNSYGTQVYIGAIAGANDGIMLDLISAGSIAVDLLNTNNYAFIGAFASVTSGPISNAVSFTNISAQNTIEYTCDVTSGVLFDNVLLSNVYGYVGQSLYLNSIDKKLDYATSTGFIYETLTNLSDPNFYLNTVLIDTGSFEYSYIDIANGIYPQVITLLPYI